MPLEFLLPPGFCPRAQVSKLFFAVEMGGKINIKAGGTHKLSAAVDEHLLMSTVHGQDAAVLTPGRRGGRWLSPGCEGL